MIGFGIRLGSASQGQPAAPAGTFITAIVGPSLLAVVPDESTLAATLPASVLSPSNYASTEAPIASVLPEWSINGGPWTAAATTVVHGGQIIRARITVLDGAANQQLFETSPVTVLPAVPRSIGTLADVLTERGQSMTAIEGAAAFSGTGLSYGLAPGSADIAALGLALDPASGRISGTPSALTLAARVVIRAANAGGHADSDFALTVADQPAQMAAPTVTASGSSGILVVRAAAPAANNAPIQSFDLRHSPNGTTWTERAGIGDQTSVTGLAAATTYRVQTRAVNALGAGAWSASANATTQALPGEPTPVTISAVLPPAMAALHEGQAVRDVPDYATMVSPANFTAAGSSIASVGVSFLGDATAADMVLAEGQQAGFEVTVTAADGTRKAFATGIVTVQYDVRLENGTDNTLTIEINNLVSSSRMLAVTVMQEPWHSRGTWPVLVSRDCLAEGPFNAVPPMIGGATGLEEAPAFSEGLWLYDHAQSEPVITCTLKADGVAVPAFVDVDFPTLVSFRVGSGQQGKLLTLTETATAGSASRSATSAGLAIPGGTVETLADAFNRPDELLTTSPNWIVFSGASPQIVSGVVKSPLPLNTVGQGPGHVYFDADLPGDQYVEVRLAELPPHDAGWTPQLFLYLRRDATGFYALRWNRTSETAGTLAIVQGVSNLGSVSCNIAPGDVLRFEATGGGLVGKVNGTTRVSTTNTARTSGKAGFGLRNFGYPGTVGTQVGAIDDFQCGGIL